MSAQVYRKWLKTQKETDVRLRGNFAQNVRIYNCMSSRRDKDKQDVKKKDLKEEDLEGSKIEIEVAETPDIKSGEKKTNVRTRRKKTFGAALNSVARLLSSRKGSRRVSKETENTPSRTAQPRF